MAATLGYSALDVVPKHPACFAQALLPAALCALLASEGVRLKLVGMHFCRDDRDRQWCFLLHAADQGLSNSRRQ